MPAENDTFHLTRGEQTLTIMKRAGRFVGLLNGHAYIVAASPDIVVRHLVEASQGAVKEKTTDPAALVRAAKRVVGDATEDATPLTKKEKAAMDAVRREAGRPSREEIREEAKRLLK